MINNIDKFEMMASKYDGEYTIMIADVIVNELKKHLNIDTNRILLDFGCGTGLVGLKLQEYYSHIIFVDPAANMLKEVSNKLSDKHPHQLLPLDLCTNETNVKSDDIIIAQTLLHLDNPKMILEKLSKILNKNGNLYIIDYNYIDTDISNEVHHGFIQEELITLLEDIGFEVINNNTFYYGKNNFLKQDGSLFIIKALLK